MPSIVALPPPGKEAVIFDGNNIPPYNEGGRVNREAQEEPGLREPFVPGLAAIVCKCIHKGLLRGFMW